MVRMWKNGGKEKERVESDSMEDVIDTPGSYYRFPAKSEIL